MHRSENTFLPATQQRAGLLRLGAALSSGAMPLPRGVPNDEHIRVWAARLGVRCVHSNSLWYSILPADARILYNVGARLFAPHDHVANESLQLSGAAIWHMWGEPKPWDVSWANGAAATTAVTTATGRTPALHRPVECAWRAFSSRWGL